MFLPVTNELTETFCIIEGYDGVLTGVSEQDLEHWIACKLGKLL